MRSDKIDVRYECMNDRRPGLECVSNENKTRDERLAHLVERFIPYAGWEAFQSSLDLLATPYTFIQRNHL